MSLALEKALGEIERGAEERLEVIRAEKQKLESGSTVMETVPKLIGHIEKVETPEDDVPERVKTVPKCKEVEDDTTTEEENLSPRPRPCKMPSVTKAKQAALEAKAREQKRRYEEATKWRRATNEALGDVDLEEVMEKMTDAETPSTSTAAVSASPVVVAEVYAKPYTESTKQRGQRSMARSEHRENWKENSSCKNKRRKKGRWQRSEN